VPFFFDTETHLIDADAGLAAPPLVCLQYAFDDDAPRILSAYHDAEELREVFVRGLAGEFVAHNSSFDLAVMAAWDPTLLPLIYKALAQDRRGRDTRIREKLIDIRFESETKRPKGFYSLAQCADRYVGRKMSKGADSWRKRYRELEHKRVSEWPRPAIRYAHDDVDALREVYNAQARKYTSPDEWFQVTAAFALQLAAVWGVRTDGTHLAPLIQKLEHDMAAARDELAAAGVYDTEKESIDTKALKKLVEDACTDAEMATPRTEAGNTKTDHATLAALAEQLPGLQHYGAYKGAEKILSTYLYPMRRGVTGPMISSPNVLVNTGRTSWQEPNLQNFPRLAGVRDCIVPRPGHLWLSVDYDALEVRTFAQVLLWAVGRSSAARFFQEDPNWDPHTYVGAKLIGVDYKEGLRLKEVDKTFKKGPRQRAKAAVFGVPGGMGAEKFRKFSLDQYGVEMTLEEARDLRGFYMELFPEVKEFFDVVDHYVRKGIPFRQFVSGRVRGGAPFPALANTTFQGLAADGAKRALIRVSAESYLNDRSPLFGSRVVVFVHDELCLEVPADRTDAAAREVVRLMESEMQIVTPDIPIRATPALSRAWVKAAEPAYRDGLLIPWEDR